VIFLVLTASNVCFLHTSYNSPRYDRIYISFVQNIDNSFWNKTGTRKCKSLVIEKKNTHMDFLRHHSDSPHKNCKAAIKVVFDYLVYHIFVVFGDQVFKQSFVIPMNTSCTLLSANLFSYSCEVEFVHKLLWN
jgi:hypothetical protein